MVSDGKGFRDAEGVKGVETGEATRMSLTFLAQLHG